MTRRRLAGIFALIVLLLTTGCDQWTVLGTVRSVGWSKGASMVYLKNGDGYMVDNDMLTDDCKKGATLKVAGFLYTCY